eukprot:15348860-Ditylum_brightwellii.AAC.1
MIQEWIKKHQPEWEMADNPIPDFTLSMASRKFGNGTGRVETMVLRIECAMENTLYFKALFSKGYANAD